MTDSELLDWADSGRIFIDSRHGTYQIRQGNTVLSKWHSMLRDALRESKQNYDNNTGWSIQSEPRRFCGYG